MAKSTKRRINDLILNLVKSTCIDTTKFISENMDRPKSASNWLKVGFHLALCEYCQEYKTQLETLRKLTKGLEKEVPKMENLGSMQSESREKLKQIIEKEL